MDRTAFILPARLPITLAFAVAATASSVASACAERVAARTADYTYLASRYESLDALEHAVRRYRPGMLGIELCSDASARTFKAVVHRFRDLALEFVLPDPAAAPCGTGTRSDASPHDIDDRTVQLYWERTMP